jgi:hypothetical protein
MPRYEPLLPEGVAESCFAHHFRDNSGLFGAPMARLRAKAAPEARLFAPIADCRDGLAGI